MQGDAPFTRLNLPYKRVFQNGVCKSNAKGKIENVKRLPKYKVEVYPKPRGSIISVRTRLMIAINIIMKINVMSKIANEVVCNIQNNNS